MWNGTCARAGRAVVRGRSTAEGKHRDPILPAKPSASVQCKKRLHQTVDGLPVQSFEGLLSESASRARVTYTLKSGKSEEKSNLTWSSPHYAAK